MADWLLRLLSLSAGGALAILVLLVIERLAGLRYAAKWRCLVWLLLCLRLGVTLSLSMNPIVPSAPIRVELPADAVIYRPVTPQTERTPATPQTPQNAPVQEERDTMDDIRLRHALLPELTHYKRNDIAFKALVLWVCALHWFNPAVWLMRRAVERDLELACDDAALRVLPEDERAAYGNTVLQAATGKKGVVSEASNMVFHAAVQKRERHGGAYPQHL